MSGGMGNVSLLELIGTVLAIVGAVVGGSTAYLRLFVGEQTAALRREIGSDIEEGFARKDLMEEKFRAVGERLDAIFDRLEDIERTGRRT